ncbi:hypothetical protein [Mesotoga prima]|uniref:hypothetical protein n=1 Tax=Mesotoga prima TaxID=1184387 RepID=UPI002FD8AC32
MDEKTVATESKESQELKIANETIVGMLDFLRSGVQDVGIQVSAIKKALVDKEIITEGEYKNAIDAVIKDINDYIEKMMREEEERIVEESN